jgi:HIV Tat-specific factor 1
MDWGEGDPSAVYGDRDRWEDRLVIIKEVFTQASIKQAIIDGDDDYLQDIHEDMKEEAEKFGEVTDVVVYDLEDPGVVTVNFRSADAAEACIKVFDGRNYDGRKLKAYTSDEPEVFHKSKAKSAAAPGKASTAEPNGEK